MSWKVGINGFGRIGRLVYRILSQHDEFEVVAVNDLASPEQLGNLLKYDSVHGRFGGTVEVGEGALTVNGKEIRVLGERDPALINRMPVSDFSEAPEAGQVLAFSLPDGEEIAGLVLAVEDDEVEVDFNPPLAGHDLAFRVQILEVDNGRRGTA